MKSETLAAKAVEKTLRGKVQKQTFPPRLEIPQKNAGFPLFTQPRLLLDTLSLVYSLVPTQTGGIGSLYHRP